MTKDAMEERRSALEDEFFHKQDQAKLEAMKGKLEAQATKEELRKVSGMTDDAVLDKLVSLGLTAKTVAALSLVPLIAVAWADGSIQDNERDAILHGAAGKGLEQGSPGFTLLENWLAKRPDDGLFMAWELYIKSLTSQLNDEQTRLLKKQILNFSSLIAGSAGGFLGIGKVAGSEEKVLARIEAAFTK
ncbi:MAG: hypothetical protein F9K40_22010 [Kofleriaceae bacterium]|nr:MAG: hypothetical protein F9K40_22010 [Kofleriaceae bacterium]